MRTPLRIFSALLLIVGLLSQISAWAGTATISSTLNGKAGVKANQQTPFNVIIDQGDVPDGTTGKIVFQLTGDQVATQATLLDLEYSLDGTNWTEVPVNENGMATINEVAVDDQTIAFRALFSAVGSYNYTLKLMNATTEEVLTTVNESVVVAFTEPTVNTTLDVYPYLIINQEYLFHPFVTAGDRAGEMVNMKIALANPAQAQNIQLFRASNAEATEFTPLTFDENGVITIGGMDGYPLADAKDVDENLFKAIFTAPGVYNYAFKIVRTDGVVLAEVNEVVTVSETAIGSTLGNKENLKATIPAEFTVSAASATLAPETLVFGRMTLTNPSQASEITLEMKGADGTYQEVSLGTDGTVMIGTMEGMALSSFRNLDFRITFDAPDIYNYTLELVKVEGNEVVATKTESVSVAAFRDATIVSTLNNKEDVTATIPEMFTVTTVRNDVTEGTMVRGKLILTDATQAEDVTLQVQLPNGSFMTLPINSEGVTFFGPEEGVAIANATTNFKVTFAEPGTYNYIVQLVAVDGGQVVATSTESVVVDAFQNATVASSFANADNILAGQETMFTLSTTKGDLSDKLVRFKFILNDATQANNIILENTDAAESVRLVFGADGIAYYMPAAGPVALANQAYNFTAQFNAAGSYNYTVQLIDAAAPGEVLATTNVSVEAKTTTNIKKGFEEGGFAVYPTLTTGTVRVDLVDARSATIQVLDMMGRSVAAKNNVNGIVEIDLSNVAKGTYVVKIQDGSNVNTQRVIVQ
ncbi:T9SS type A sorting domain-containing protein [Pontibacter locisalis]|uniref:T9SS type A sorting domain-containing protein n=1 Tax=Pontibacter locisalis TaxID=1719035 RepID=A0ABW5IJ16_9BACT